MTRKILYVFRGDTQKRILEKTEEKAPYDFLYGLNHLKEQFDCDYIIAPRGTRLSLIEKLLYIPEKPFNILTRLGLPLDIYPLFRKKLVRADTIICVNDAISFGILFYKMMNLFKGRVFVLFHSLPERLKHFEKRRLLIAFISKLLSHADCVLTLSGYAQKSLIDTFKVSPSRLQTFYFGVDVDYWRPGAKGKREKFVLTVGNDMNRDYDTLVDAIPENTDLVMVTSKKVDTKGKPNVKVVSGIPDSELRNLYQTCMVTVIPSVKVVYESPGLSCALQAMACKAPVLISDSPCHREYFIEGEHIYYYEPGNSMSLQNELRRITDNYQEALSVAEQAYRLVNEKFTTRNMAGTWQHILDGYK